MTLKKEEFWALLAIAQLKTEHFDGFDPENLVRSFILDLVEAPEVGGNEAWSHAWQWLICRFGVRKKTTVNDYWLFEEQLEQQKEGK